MGKVRWTGWTMAIATAFVISGGQSARADVASDKPAAIVVYPKIVVDSSNGVNTVIRLTNTNFTSAPALQQPVFAHCFYINANSHCKGATTTGQDPVCGVVGLRSIACTGSPAGTCTPPGMQELDFDIVLTPGQPLEWDAASGLMNSALPLATGHCATTGAACSSNADCAFPPSQLPFCSASNAGTAVPPVTEDPFVGELRCIEMDNTFAQPVTSNDLKGEALIETLPPGSAGAGSFPNNIFDVASYNAIGIQATGAAIDPTVPLTLGPGSAGEYNGCPGVLILNHFFEGAVDPVANTINAGATVSQAISTDLTLVPCSLNYETQLCGTAIVQYLVFNEFEQRFSTSKTMPCWQEINLCQIDTTQCTRSIFSASVSGTLTGQTRLTPIAASAVPGLVLPTNGILGVAIERHMNSPIGTLPPYATANVHSAAFNLHFGGSLANPDTITLP